MKIAHESPISLFEKVQQVTDYDYFLVHLFEQNPSYVKCYEKSKILNRETILDNSIFELGVAFDMDKFAESIVKLEPTWYIVPDVLEDAQGTVDNIRVWNDKFSKKVPGKKIGVVQGRSYSEITDCYDYMVNFAKVDMVAISFDYSYYEYIIPHPNKYVSWMLGRVQLLSRMVRDNVIIPQIPVHLLGCALPQEFSYYKEYDWIYSLDTSNPVVHGLKKIEYTPTGLWSKESQKLCDLVEFIPDQEAEFLVMENIGKFRNLLQRTDNEIVFPI
jgi:hypothetical protein